MSAPRVDQPLILTNPAPAFVSSAPVLSDKKEKETKKEEKKHERKAPAVASLPPIKLPEGSIPLNARVKIALRKRIEQTIKRIKDNIENLQKEVKKAPSYRSVQELQILTKFTHLQRRYIFACMEHKDHDVQGIEYTISKQTRDAEIDSWSKTYVQSEGDKLRDQFRSKDSLTVDEKEFKIRNEKDERELTEFIEAQKNKIKSLTIVSYNEKEKIKLDFENIYNEHQSLLKKLDTIVKERTIAIDNLASKEEELRNLEKLLAKFNEDYLRPAALKGMDGLEMYFKNELQFNPSCHDIVDKAKFTMLHYACYFGMLNLATDLISHYHARIIPSKTDVALFKVLHPMFLVIENNLANTTDFLILLKPTSTFILEQADARGRSALTIAAEVNNIKATDWLLEKVFDHIPARKKAIDAANLCVLPLHAAIEKGHFVVVAKILTFLKKLEYNYNQLSFNGISLAKKAFMHGKPEVVKVLVEIGGHRLTEEETNDILQKVDLGELNKDYIKNCFEVYRRKDETIALKMSSLSIADAQGGLGRARSHSVQSQSASEGLERSPSVPQLSMLFRSKPSASGMASASNPSPNPGEHKGVQKKA